MIDPPGSGTADVTTFTYTLAGRNGHVPDTLEKVRDANHPKASNPNPTQLCAYDALNRLTTTTVGPGTAGSAATAYTYDVQDHLSTVTDAEGNLTTYTYSDRDLLTQQVSLVSGTTTYTYDAHGELATTTDARSIVTTRTLDVLDRVTAASYSDGTPGTGYAYDVGAFAKGRLSSITRSGQTISYGYDRFGRLTQGGAVAYAYDANGNRTRMTYPNNVTAVYAHDFANLDRYTLDRYLPSVEGASGGQEQDDDCERIVASHWLSHRHRSRLISVLDSSGQPAEPRQPAPRPGILRPKVNGQKTLTLRLHIGEECKVPPLHWNRP
jgi:YD repeat-containing protein